MDETEERSTQYYLISENEQWAKVIKAAKQIFVRHDYYSAEMALKRAQQFWDYIEAVEKIAICESEE